MKPFREKRMTKIASFEDLKNLQKRLQDKMDPQKRRVFIANLATCCQARGSKYVTTALKEEIEKQGLKDKIEVKETGCQGFCEREPLMVIQPGDIFYQRITPQDAPEIASKTLVNGQIIERLLYKDPQIGKVVHQSEIPFYKKQMTLISGNNRRINPTSILDYIAIGGYSSLGKAFRMSPKEVISEIERSGLRGRGGAGFPTGRKWRSAQQAPGTVKYIIANGDEGNPGAFMDRSLMEGNPHSILEGMIIGAYAIGAHEGYIYVREEYPLAVKHLSLESLKLENTGYSGKTY